MDYDNHLCFRINKSTKQSWLGFKRSEDPCLYFKRCSNGVLTVIAPYVDDIIIGSTCTDERDRVKTQLSLAFKCEDNGVLVEFLGLNVIQTPRGIFVSQPGYIERVYQKFHELCSKYPTTHSVPMA